MAKLVKAKFIPPDILSLCTEQKRAGRFTPRPLYLLGKSPITTGRVSPRTNLDTLEKQANVCT
jgi:hypothetical protein